MATLFLDLARTSDVVAGASGRNDKVAALADVLRRLEPDEIVDAVAFLAGRAAIGRIGVGWATLSDVRPPPAAEPSLTIGEVAHVVTAIAAMSGAGVIARRRQGLHDLLASSTEREQAMLRAIVSGELRQGALDGVLTTAVAKAAGVTVAAVRRASMMVGELGPAAAVALTTGVGGLAAVTLQPGRPIQPMLASTAASAGEAVLATGMASVEWKLDGARLQAHRSSGEVRLFTRNLNDITDRLPGIVETVRALPGGDLVLDGEAMGLIDIDTDTDTDTGGAMGVPKRFQDTMGDFGAGAAACRGHTIRAFFFDALHLDGESIHDRPLSERRDRLQRCLPAVALLPSIVTADAVEAEAFMEQAIGQGHEGVMVKGIDEPYEAGRRGKSWRKVKPVYTLDLVVLAIEWGHGRRAGKLSNLHLGARGDGGDFVMVGKTFKGMTDDMLTWQTERFQSIRIGADGGVVHVEPVQVVEIAIDGVQMSTRYPGGVALRFARVKRYRNDKSASQADTIAEVQSMLR